MANNQYLIALLNELDRFENVYRHINQAHNIEITYNGGVFYPENVDGWLDILSSLSGVKTKATDVIDSINMTMKAIEGRANAKSIRGNQ